MHRLGGVLLDGGGGLRGGGLRHSLGGVAHLPRAYHLTFLEAEVVLHAGKDREMEFLDESLTKQLYLKFQEPAVKLANTA